MSYPTSHRSAIVALSLSALCFACGADQKTSNTPDDASLPEAPADTSTPQPSDSATPAAPSEPTSASPQSMAPMTPGNVAATTKPTTDSAAAARLTESQIAMVADLANSSEAEHGKLALGKAQAASVKKFAAMMVKHHTDAKAEQAKLFKQLNLTPTQSQTSTSLKQNADRASSALRASTTGSFDERYIDSQVEAHQQVLDMLNNELLPAATEQELIGALNKMKATVEAHLREAKTIQGELSKVRQAK